ncbi:hypothetical protein E3N88_39491 [Mikania micrantha]|uniref:Replication factor A C-terminal domain-containing protein n=1 Tax=Mikania micrantha TaxID=192012 RepID=A0A5N6LWX7_9ASTR|nr:hypothetical protein E3N88_39491 [Mikania micrantha]
MKRKTQSNTNSSLHCQSPNESYYLDNGDCSYVCEFCKAFFWFDERNIRSSTTRHPRYNQCCKGGRVKLQLPTTPHPTIQTHFTCLASITDISAYRTWYYALCSDCTKKVYPKGINMVCEDHGTILDPNYMYCVKVAEETSTTNMVFFNEAITSIVNIKCAEMVINHGYTDPKTIPTPILSVRGIPKILHITLKRDGTISVHKVVDTFATPTKTTYPHGDAQYNAKPLTKPSKRQVLHAQGNLSQKPYKKKIKYLQKECTGTH